MNNPKDTITETLQEILNEDPNFTNRLNILSWKSKKNKGALITKIGNIRYLGLLRKDQKGQEYWKYKPLTSNSGQSGRENSTIQPNNSSQQLATDNIAKFQQRQQQARNYGKLDNSQVK